MLWKENESEKREEGGITEETSYVYIHKEKNHYCLYTKEEDDRKCREWKRRRRERKEVGFSITQHTQGNRGGVS